MAVSTMLKPAELKVTESVVQAYAQITNDFNPIHVDPEFAAGTPLGGAIAHGTLSLCLVWQCLQDNFGDNVFADLDLDVRFVKPVFVGETVTAGGRKSDDEPGRYEIWVRGADGSDRISGSLRLPAISDLRGDQG